MNRVALGHPLKAVWRTKVGGLPLKRGFSGTALCHATNHPHVASTRQPLLNSGFLYAQADGSSQLPEFYVVDSTLREGEQFSSTEYSSADRLYIAKCLDKLGVDYIEVMNPSASSRAEEECATLATLGLKAKIVAHVRCHMDDVKKAVASGVQGVHCYMATSKALREHSHGKDIEAITEIAGEVITYVKDHSVEVRFSCEDTFRSNVDEILKIYSAVDKLGVDRVGIADTVGLATPMQVYNTVAQVRSVLRPSTGIELHVHDDAGCCVANALMGIEAGATHIDTCVLGLGERNGITPLGALLARLYTINKEYIKGRFDLTMLHSLDKFLSRIAGVPIPFNNCITGSAAFTHKAGVHSKAVMSNPGSYEVINPEDFGVTRKIQLAHRLTGWNAMKHRAGALSLKISDKQIKAATSIIKNIADKREVTQDHVDAVLLRLASLPNPELFDEGALEDGKSAELDAAAEAARLALDKYQTALIVDAIDSVPRQEDTLPSMIVDVTGHLFDSRVINKLLDIAVDSACNFKVMNTIIPPKNEQESKVVIKLSAPSDDNLEDTLASFKKMLDSTGATFSVSVEKFNPQEPLPPPIV